MVGRTLHDTRAQIDRLADDTGDYYVRCGRTGYRPFPIAGAHFTDRETAAEAARYAHEYRSELRRYDPKLSKYDLIVCEQTGLDTASTAGVHDRTGASEAGAELDLPIAESVAEFCHAVASALFESLSEHGCDTVETSVMDSYLDAAETVADRDELCIVLLDVTARTVDQSLSRPQQTVVLRDAASRLPSSEGTRAPVRSALVSLVEAGIVDDCAWGTRPTSGGPDEWLITLWDYALGRCGDRLPVLPVVIELLRHEPDALPDMTGAVEIDCGWQLRLYSRSSLESDTLTSVPIDPDIDG